MKKITIVIRTFASLILLWLAYGETGIWTTIILALCMVSIEINTVIMQKTLGVLNEKE